MFGRLLVVLLAATPLLEWRAAFPVAVGVYHLSPWEAFVWIAIGNMIPPLLILYTWDWVVRMAEKHWPALHRFLERSLRHLHGMAATKIDRYGPWVLAVFVALPIPLTGVWSGALIAWLFQIPKHKALLSLFVGLIIGLIFANLVLGTTQRFF